MPPAADTIRILIATDSHVGYNERDPIRGDDSWRSFDEVMSIAKDRGVDMILLSGDLFHDNKPSQKAMYHVMKSLRENCLGDKPCELEILSDTSAEFQMAGGNVNYENPDMNVAIPVFSIHGNHDDPSGEGRFCPLDILSIAGLMNYYGRTPENDNITCNPVLLQKGRTKLGLFGISNVRDERLFRTFRDGKVKFLRPEVQQKEWFNLLCVHQNHHGHTETGYLPENFLPEFLNLVIWGHEHECLIDPRINPEMGFSVIQPGSSIATSLCEGEAVPKHCGILSLTGREFSLEKIRLKTVRPFVMRDIVLAQESKLKNVWKKLSNRTIVTTHLCTIIDELISEATEQWLEAQENEDLEENDVPLPLVRLRVEYSAPEGGKFETENPQRFSNRFVGRVANVNDVVQFYRKKSAIQRTKTGSVGGDIDSLAGSSLLEKFEGNIDEIKVEELVKEFLQKATLEILPSNGLGDAVGQFVDKDDRHAVETFVDESLKAYITKMREYDDLNEETIAEVVTEHKSYLENLFEKGLRNTKRRITKYKEKPDNWDSDIDGNWEDQPAAQINSDQLISDNEDEDGTPVPRAHGFARGRGSRGSRGGRGSGASRSSTSTTRKVATATALASRKKVPAKPAATGRGGRKKAVVEVSEDEEMLDVFSDEEDEGGEEDEDEEPLSPPKRQPRTRASAAKPAPKPAPKPVPKPATRSKHSATAVPVPAKTRQAKLNFNTDTSQSSQLYGSTQASNALFHRNVVTIPSDDEDIDDDDDDEFVSLTSQNATVRRR